MSHVRDRWMQPGPAGRRIRTSRWGRGLRWQAVWYEAGQERTKGFANRDAADTHLARVELGEMPRPQLVTFGEYAELWRTQQLHHRPSTAAAAADLWRLMLLPALGRMPLGKLTRADVQAAVVAWSGHYSPSRVHIAYGYVATVLRHAVEDRLIPFSPCVRVSLPQKNRTKVQPLTVQQVGEIAERVPAWYRSMVIVGAATGLRGGELRGLTWDRVINGILRVDRQLVDVQHGQVVYGPPKSSAGVRVVPLGEVAAAELEAHRTRWPSPDLVWRTRYGTPMDRAVAGEAWRRSVGGMDLRPRSGWHDLRHHHASLLIAAGLSPRAVADRLGHADPSETLRTYAHLWPSDQARATTAVDLALGGLVGPSGTVTYLADRAPERAGTGLDRSEIDIRKRQSTPR